MSGIKNKQFFGHRMVFLIKTSMISTQRLLLLLFLITSSIILCTTKVPSYIVGVVHSRTLDVFSPILYYINKPFVYFQKQIQQFNQMAQQKNLYETLENIAVDLQSWKMKAEILQRENSQLRALLKTVPQKSFPFITAKVLGAPSGREYSTLIVDLSNAYVISENSPVLSAKGLVGRISIIGNNVTQIALITDFYARTPVRFSANSQQAILAGNGTGELEITHLRQDFNHLDEGGIQGSAISVGDLLLTSGFGGIYPSDIPVAIVSRLVEHDGQLKIYAKPVDDVRALEFIRILDKSYEINNTSGS